jgi:hypothetical protein
MAFAGGLLALLALALLPGLLLARAPWAVVPALSLAFWTVGAGWLARPRALPALLVAFAVLAALRVLPKSEVPPPPGWTPPAPPTPTPRPGRPSVPFARGPSLVVLAAALALFLPAGLWPHAPGPGLAFQTTAARLVLWHDGLPGTGEPLLPLAPMGAHAPAVASLAAAVSALSGLDPAPALVLVLLAAAACALLGLFALHATWAPSWPAALGALVSLAVAPWPGTLRLFGEGEALLALAFALPGAALLAGHASRSSAAAAALLFAAAAQAQPLLAATALVSGWAVAAKLRPREGLSRGLSCGALALLLSSAGLVPLARALSLRETVSLASSVRLSDLLPFTVGLLALALMPVALLRLDPGRARRLPAAALALVGAALLLLRVHGWIAAGQLPAAEHAALVRLRAEAPPLEVVCAADPARDWVPAIAGRAAGEPGPWIPAVYAEEWARRTRRPCGRRLEDVLAGR